MADIEKLEDGELDAVSGGQKFFIGGPPVTVYDAPGGRPLCVLYKDRGDFFVTTNEYVPSGGTTWVRVYTSHMNGYVNINVF